MIPIATRRRLEAGLLLADLHILPDVDLFVPIGAAGHARLRFRIGGYPVTNAKFRRFVAAAATPRRDFVDR